MNLIKIIEHSHALSLVCNYCNQKANCSTCSVSQMKKDAEHNQEELKRYISMYKDTIISEGIIRWISNDRVPPKELLTLWNYLKFPFDYNKSVETGALELADSMEEYCKRQQDKKFTAEEIYEMKAAFGENAKVKDIISGKEFDLSKEAI